MLRSGIMSPRRPGPKDGDSNPSALTRLQTSHGQAADYRRFSLQKRMGPAPAGTSDRDGASEEDGDADGDRLSASFRQLVEREARRSAPDLASELARAVDSVQRAQLPPRTQRRCLRFLQQLLRSESGVVEALRSLADIANARGLKALPEEVQHAALDALVRVEARPALRRAMIATLETPGVADLARTDQLALIRHLAGPDLGPGADPARAQAVATAWDQERARMTRALAAPAFRRAAPQAQIAQLSRWLHEPTEVATLAEGRQGIHAFLLLGAGRPSPLISYGMLVAHAGAAQRWFTVESPDLFQRAGWPTDGPVAQEVYDEIQFSGTALDHCTIIEGVEQGFAVNRDKPEVNQGGRSSDFSGFALALLSQLGKERPDLGVVSRRSLRAGKVCDDIARPSPR